jgi:hypothetical protein
MIRVAYLQRHDDQKGNTLVKTRTGWAATMLLACGLAVLVPVSAAADPPDSTSTAITTSVSEYVACLSEDTKEAEDCKEMFPVHGHGGASDVTPVVRTVARSSVDVEPVRTDHSLAEQPFPEYRRMSVAQYRPH